MKNKHKKVLIGKCKQCGKCCKDIPLDCWMDNKNLMRIKLEDKFTWAVGKLTIKNPFFDFSDITGINFNKNAVHILGVECRALIKKRGKYYCSIHDEKPKLCIEHPQVGHILLKGCGYKIITKKK